ncbi:MAG: glycine--tRNA ligase subunit beta [Gammaproteobacteria bacterium]|nr:glycine--tRNA ligase subunit beta [Gammaproteobacteria bacterium]
MTGSAPMLLEVGTEELPPTALKGLGEALARGFAAGLDKAGLAHGAVTMFATPRRLAVLVEDLERRQPDRETERRGPAVKAAFDADGMPTKAAQGFARSCGVPVEDLARVATDKGEWLAYTVHEQGQDATELLPAIAAAALDHLPIPKRMRWGERSAEFVRPVHWVLFLHGADVVPCRLLETPAGNTTRGHRFHHPAAITVDHPHHYRELLRAPGRVVADFDERRDTIRHQVEQAAGALGGRAEMDEALLEEVTALVEWPVAITGGFEERFLEVPHEALILTMKKNQKYFHLVDAEGRLLPHFITIANVDSPRPEVIKEGNERVIRPRLTDAMFFWEQDGKKTLAERVESLKSVVFQQRLGSIHAKSLRVAELAAAIAEDIGGDAALARRAGMLSRCDLMTEMVYEFPEMQGIMGRYQALRDSEPAELATAMDEFYMPRFSGDRLPGTVTGRAVSLAERLDTLVGIFGIGQRPTGDRDPFALRRAALGALRMLREEGLPLELRGLLEQARAGLGDLVTEADTVDAVYDFMLERLKGLYLEAGVGADVFEAVAAVAPARVADFDARIDAVTRFRTLPEAEVLAGANKRIHNILRKADVKPPDHVDVGLLQDPAERALAAATEEAATTVAPLLEAGDYATALARLATLRATVDTFFDQVMVMADDPAVRNNRLALLNRLGGLFLATADISRLQD